MSNKNEDEDSSDEPPQYGLSEIYLKDKDTFDHFFSKPKTILSDYTFANTYIWRDSIRLKWKIIADNLCVFANGDGGLTMLFPPIGDGNFTKAILESIEVCKQYNSDVGYNSPVRIEYISEDFLNRFSIFSLKEMSGDYVYETNKMINLDGSSLSSKRQSKNRFMRKYPDFKTEQYDDSHFENCLELLDTWEVQTIVSPEARTSSDIKRAKEILATTEALKRHKELGLVGMVLYVGDKVIGFTLGERIGTDTCNILIEKTDREFTGSAQYIFSEFCRQYWADTKWCNAGDDWEVESLAWTKQSYCPAMRLPKWTAYPKSTISYGSVSNSKVLLAT